MAECDRAGFFRAEIIEYGLQNSDSGAVGVSFRALLTELWDGENWHDWRAYDMGAYGTSWIIKKDGAINEKATESLIRHAGWDGSLASIAESTWKPTPCQVEVKEDTYKDETRYKVAWLNAFDSTPGGGALGNVTTDKLKELEARFGGPLRAIGANVKRNQPAANSRPPAPPRPPAPAMAGGDGEKF